MSEINDALDIEAIIERVQEADREEMKEMFGDLLSKARHYAHSHSVCMLVRGSGDKIERDHYVVKQSEGEYIPRDRAKKYHAILEVKTDAFLSYEDVRESVIRDLRRYLIE